MKFSLPYKRLFHAIATAKFSASGDFDVENSQASKPLGNYGMKSNFVTGKANHQC